MREDYLPLGSIVLLKDARRQLMVIGYSALDMKNKKMFDYAGVLYPEGFLDSSLNLLFNHSQIDKIINIGYTDDFAKKYLEELNKANKNKTNEQLCEETLKEIESRVEMFNKKVKEDQARQGAIAPSANEESFGVELPVQSDIENTENSSSGEDSDSNSEFGEI